MQRPWTIKQPYPAYNSATLRRKPRMEIIVSNTWLFLLYKNATTMCVHLVLGPPSRCDDRSVVRD